MVRAGMHLAEIPALRQKKQERAALMKPQVNQVTKTPCTSTTSAAELAAGSVAKS
jgi:hypothetical protein